MAEAGADQPNHKKEFPKVQKNRILTLFEHRFIGGSEDVNGKRYDGSSLTEDVKNNNGVIPEEYFKPVAVMRDGDDIYDVNKDRKDSYLRGALGFFGESIYPVFDNGYDLAMQLPQADPKTGVTSQEWKVFLIKNGDVVYDKDVLGQLAPSGSLMGLLDCIVVDDGLKITTKPLQQP